MESQIKRITELSICLQRADVSEIHNLWLFSPIPITNRSEILLPSPFCVFLESIIVSEPVNVVPRAYLSIAMFYLASDGDSWCRKRLGGPQVGQIAVLCRL